MNVINRRAVRRMILDHSTAATALDAWWKIAKSAHWSHLEACRKSFTSADQVGRCLIFNIQSNTFRLITVVNWLNQRIYVKALLTHREYERNTWHKRAF